MKINKIFLTFLIISSSFVLVSKVSAHAIRENNGMSVMMHINSDDLAYTGQQNNLAFYLTYKDVHTDIKDCECLLEVFRDGKKVLSREVTDTNNKLKISKMAIYIIRISGKPKTAGQFEPFSVEWDIRPEEGEGSGVGQFVDENFTILIIGVVLFILIFFSVKMWRK